MIIKVYKNKQKLKTYVDFDIKNLRINLLKWKIFLTHPIHYYDNASTKA